MSKGDGDFIPGWDDLPALPPADVWCQSYLHAIDRAAEIQSGMLSDIHTLEERCKLLQGKLTEAQARGDTYKQAYETAAQERRQLLDELEQLKRERTLK